MEDEKIVDLYWARSEKAVSETAAKYGKYCRKIAANILSDCRDADEAVNEAYLGAWNSIPPHEPENLGTFLGKIVRAAEIQPVIDFHFVSDGRKQKQQQNDSRGRKGDDFPFSAHQFAWRQHDKHQKSENQAHADDRPESKGETCQQDGKQNIPYGVFLAANQVIHALKGKHG